MSEQETVETTAVETTRTVETTTPAQVTTEAPGADLGKVRELVLKAHPDVVPDLVRGGSGGPGSDDEDRPGARGSEAEVTGSGTKDRPIAGSEQGGLNHGDDEG